MIRLLRRAAPLALAVAAWAPAASAAFLTDE